MIPDEQLNFEASVQSGQVFRFVRTDTGWAGIDGDNMIEAERVPGGWIVQSRPNSTAWKQFLQIDLDLAKIRSQMALIEPRLAPIMEALPGLRTLRPSSATETIFSFLCTANNHMSRIVGMTGFLASKGLEVGGGHYVFPTVAQVAEISEAELRSKGFGYRAATIPTVARELLERGEGWLERLKVGGYTNARDELCRLSGVGPKLADCICLFGLHFDEAVPIDTHVWKAAVEWYAPQYGDRPVSPSGYLEVSRRFRERFGKLSGWAQQYLFYNRFISYRNKSRRLV